MLFMTKIALKYCRLLHHQSIALSAYRSNSEDALKLVKLLEELDKKQSVVNIDKKDVVATYSAGSSKGGQKANKSHSLVRLRHIPTGKIAEGRDTRMLPDNYKFAMARLRKTVDIHMKGDNSIFTIIRNDELAKAKIKKELHQKRLENEAKLKEILEQEDVLKY